MVCFYDSNHDSKDGFQFILTPPTGAIVKVLKDYRKTRRVRMEVFIKTLTILLLRQLADSADRPARRQAGRKQNGENTTFTLKVKKL